MKTVLIVEDSGELAELEAEIVGLVGGEATITADGATALALLRQGEFDLVLLDLSLPTVGGQAVLDEMATDPALARRAVIVVSAEVERLRRTPQVMAAFHKPCDPGALAAAIVDALAAAAGPSAGLRREPEAAKS